MAVYILEHIIVYLSGYRYFLLNNKILGYISILFYIDYYMAMCNLFFEPITGYFSISKLHQPQSVINNTTQYIKPRLQLLVKF